MKIYNTMKEKKYTFALTLIFSLFFIWAISSNLLPTMIRQLMKTFELSAFQTSLTEASYWIAYFIFPIPIAMFMKRYSYKAGIVVGLFIAALGESCFSRLLSYNNIGPIWGYSLLSQQVCVSLKRRLILL